MSDAPAVVQAVRNNIISSWTKGRAGGGRGDHCAAEPRILPSLLLSVSDDAPFSFSSPPSRVYCVYITPIPPLPSREVLQHVEGRQDGGRERRRRRRVARERRREGGAARHRRGHHHPEGWCAHERLPADSARRSDPAVGVVAAARPRIADAVFIPGGRTLVRVRVRVDVDTGTRARGCRSAPSPSTSPYCTPGRSWW